jgi:hypothetical protein
MITDCKPIAFLLSAVFLFIGIAAFASGQNDQSGGDEVDLDLREANVTAVQAADRGGGSLGFDVTLIHDDDGEDGYANWWQVETLQGEQLGRRELLHAHGTREFTRSQTIEIPAGVAWVVVRGHDQTHGYGGRAAVYSVETGETVFVDQGSKPEEFSDWSPEG